MRNGPLLGDCEAALSPAVCRLSLAQGVWLPQGGAPLTGSASIWDLYLPCFRPFRSNKSELCLWGQAGRACGC